MTKDQVIAKLRVQIGQTDGQNAWARQNGVDPALVSRVLAGAKPLSFAVLRPLGLVRTVSYEPVDQLQLAAEGRE